MKEIFEHISELTTKPKPFSKSKDVIWTDPYISEQLLLCHLSQDTEAASRNRVFVNESIAFMMQSGYIRSGDCLLDLGCGPGIYAERLSSQGVHVTGIDFSSNSIDFARESAKKKGLAINYEWGNILDMDYHQSFDAVIQIYGELNVFSPNDLEVLLEKVFTALKPKGYFIFDVTTPVHRDKNHSKNCWYTEENGFWGQGKNIILEQGYAYKEDQVWLDRYFVVNEDGFREYRNWFKDYNLKSISDIVTKAGFRICETYGDLTGRKMSEGDEWIALIVEKEG